MMTRTRRHCYSAISLLAGVVSACGNSLADDPVDQKPGAQEVAVTEQPFNTSYAADPNTSALKGHEQITKKAIALLAARNLLPLQLRTPDAQNKLVYGSYFADNPWAGVPSQPQQTRANSMSPNIPSGGLRFGSTTGEFHFDFDAGSVLGIDIEPKLTLDATAESKWVRGTAGTVQASDALRFTIGLNATVHEFIDIGGASKQLEFAQDNLYHYAHADLKDFNDPSITSDQYALRFYPFYPQHVPSDQLPQNAKDTLASKLNQVTVVTGADFGVTKYGAILYQLARKFFVGSPSQPNISELVKVGNDVPGWHTGGVQGSGELNEMQFSFPHTYLGGMPYVCGNSTSADPCATGTPNWPVWATINARTGGAVRSNDTALIYLGWAAHMIQDASLPHHVANWAWTEHDVQDGFGDTSYFYSPSSKSLAELRMLMDTYMAADLDALLGQVNSPKSIEAICSSVGITDSQVVDGSLNWASVHGVFLANAKNAHRARKEVANVNDGAVYVKNAILGTIKLLLCAPSSKGPRTEAFTRYYNSTTSQHWVSTDSAPGLAGFTHEGRLAYTLNDWAPGLHAIYSCLAGTTDHFVSVASNCEGQTLLHHEGYAYNAPGTGLIPLYRCRKVNGHFVSASSNCEGQMIEGAIGYFPVEPAAIFYGANTNRQNVSGRTLDWDSGYWSATCDDTEAALGLSASTDSRFTHGLLCKNVGTRSLGGGNTVTLPGDGRRYFRTPDWDFGNWKLECGLNEYVSGASQSQNANPSFHGLRCSPGAGSENNCEARIVSGSTGYSGAWGDWDWGYYKADCPQDKVMVGASFDPSSYKPHAIFCCNP